MTIKLLRLSPVGSLDCLMTNGPIRFPFLYYLKKLKTEGQKLKTL